MKRNDLLFISRSLKGTKYNSVGSYHFLVDTLKRKSDGTIVYIPYFGTDITNKKEYLFKSADGYYFHDIISNFSKKLLKELKKFEADI